jgi:hypothetical protein
LFAKVLIIFCYTFKLEFGRQNSVFLFTNLFQFRFCTDMSSFIVISIFFIDLVA